MLACSLGVRQTKVDANLRKFFLDARPWSFILFREACASREQVRALCADLREAVGFDALIWIDQEGGRVARLKPPEWPVWPAAAAYGKLHGADDQSALEAARLGYRLIAHELKSIGVDGDFAPVLDIPAAGSDKSSATARSPPSRMPSPPWLPPRSRASMPAVLRAASNTCQATAAPRLTAIWRCRASALPPLSWRPIFRRSKRSTPPKRQ